LPLYSDTKLNTAIAVYEDLVLGKALVARNLFPFAVDGGGEHFFVDCNNPDAAVYYFRSENLYLNLKPLEKVANSLEQFWSMLQLADE
jgi:hypothetical protein